MFFFADKKSDHFRVHLCFDLYNNSEIEWKKIWKNRLKMMSFKFRVVLCRIRLFPSLISKIKWLRFELLLIFFSWKHSFWGLLFRTWKVSRFQVDYWPNDKLQNYTDYLGVIEIGERPRGISLRGELQLQLAVSTEAKPDSSSLNKLKCQLKVKIK